LTGTLLNGISEGAAFGDDAQMNSNYPLVRLTNAVSGLVYYARTYNWSSTSVMTGSSLESTHFTMPASAPYGSYSLVVVANGISSDPVEVNYGPVLNISVLRHWILLNWIEGAAESGSLMNLPSFGLERADDLVSAAGGAPGFTNDIIVRSLNGQFVAREAMNAGSEYYRLNAAATNTVVPPASTLPASNVTATGAWFNGTDVPIGSNTLYWFEYGQDTNYSQTTPTNSLDTSANPVSVNFSVGGLYPLFLYHCQLVVMDDWGAQYGGDQTFTTPGLPPVVDTQPASAIGETSAQLNGTVNGEGQPIAGYFQYWYLEQTDGGNYWITNQTTPEFYGPSSYAVQAFSATVTNLNPTTTYYYQIVARNLVARVFGGVTNFTTTP
jgi:hypothetical protein